MNVLQVDHFPSGELAQFPSGASRAPDTNQGVFELRRRQVPLPDDLVLNLERMVSFRNALVYDYDRVELSVVRTILVERLDDLLEFATLVHSHLPM